MSATNHAASRTVTAELLEGAERGVARAARWVWDRAVTGTEAVVICAVGAVTFATSASHVLDLGHRHQVVGWHSWSVAGTAEILVAYAGLEAKRRRGLARLLPLVVFIGMAAFLLLANLASRPESPAADLLPWGQVYAAFPPLAFIAVAVLAETKSWRWPARRQAAPDTAEDTGQDTQDDSRVDTGPDSEGDTEQDIGADTVVSLTGRRGRVLAQVMAGQLTRSKAAEKLGVSTRTVSRWLKPHDMPEEASGAR